MATSRRPRTVLYRRKREGKTDYNKRLKLLTSQKPRLLVRLTNNRVIGQVVVFSPLGDQVQEAVSSTLLKKYGWNSSMKNVPSAYLTGFILGKKAVKKGIKEAVLDTGFRKPLRNGKIYAFLKGAVDAGLIVPHGGKDIFPKQEVIEGQHLKNNVKDLIATIKKMN